MQIKRVLLAVLALLLSIPLLGASVLDRSPFAQGLWWEPARAGSGFEIFNAGGQVMAVWYTFDEAGKPVWYTAQGPQSSLGSEDWALLKHRWAGGHAGATAVGTLRVAVKHPESLEVAWQLGTQRGTALLEPFIQSGVVNELDRTGTWFDPSNSGWGLTLLEQGEVTGAALFTYDRAGEPTWTAGFERTRGTVALSVYSGACPSCAYRPPTTVTAGRLWLESTDDSQLTVRDGMTLAMADGIALNGARLSQLSRPASTRAADRQLAGFDDASLRAYFAAGMLNTPAYYTGDFSAGSPAQAFSTTNLQEAGVDEAALVRSNGAYVYAYEHASGGGPRLPSIRIVRIESDGAVAKAAGSVAIGTGARTPMGAAGLYLFGNNLVSVHGSQMYSYAFAGWAGGAHWANGLTQVEILDISSPEQPASRWRADIDGYIVSSRRVGPMLYVVSRFTPWPTGFVFGATNPTQVATNQQILATVTLDQFLPKARVTDGTVAPIVASSQVYAPPQGSRKAIADLIVVTAIDLEKRRIVQSLGIVGGVETVYASPDNLFVASTRAELRNTYGALLPEPPMVRTDLHQIRLRRDGMALVGSASVEGYLSGQLDQASFRLSERNGKLRVVTTARSNLWGAGNTNRLTILEPSAAAPGLLKTVSWLPNAQRPQTLGKPGETLYATRFVDDRLYAVTFKKIDPLYVVDLSNAADPRIAGALEIPGFSEYLHPLPNGLMLGFGKDTVPAADFGDGGQFAWYQGLQLALYDVRDAGKPLEMQRVLVGKRGSNSALLQHHHAFSSLELSPDRTLIGIPASVNEGAPSYSSGPSTYYSWSYSGLLRFELLGNSPVDARLVLAEPLVSAAAVPGYPSSPTDYGSDARSVLFPGGALYVSGGRFWHRAEGGATTGPF